MARATAQDRARSREKRALNFHFRPLVVGRSPLRISSHCGIPALPTQFRSLVNISPAPVQSPAPLSDVLTAPMEMPDACVANFPARAAKLDAHASVFPRDAATPVASRQIHRRARVHLRRARVQLCGARHRPRTRTGPTSPRPCPAPRNARPTFRRARGTSAGVQFFPKPAVSTSA